MKTKRSSVVILFALICSATHSQIIEHPNYGLKSHETLNLGKVEMTAQKTTLYLMIENRIAEGNFCADKNIYLISSKGERFGMIKAVGIPICPDNHSFKNIGEALNFSLEFPAIKPGTKWIDIIEDCTSNCFWFYGVTLDNELNVRLDKAFDLAAKGQPADNISLFKNILDDIDNQDLGIEGLLYINIINAAVENADKVNSIVWYKRLVASHAPRLDQYVKYLNDKGIKY